MKRCVANAWQRQRAAQPIRMWIDCEFNGFGGELISMALVAEDERDWYRVLPCDSPDPWVSEHVMPILFRRPIQKARFARSLQDWLRPYSSVHVIADWPEDISHFCQSLVIGPGVRIDTPALTMEIRRDLDIIPSALPHNALADAWALHRSQLALEARKESL